MTFPPSLSAQPASEPNNTAHPGHIKQPHPVKAERKSRSFPRKLKNLNIKLESARTHYRATEPITVKYEIKNESKTPMRILVWGTPLEGFQSDMFKIAKDGVEIPYRGKLASRVAPTDSDYITLKENQSIARELDLSEAYDIQDNGEYVLHHRMRTLQVDLEKEKADALTRKFHRDRDDSKQWKRQRTDVDHQPLTFRQEGVRHIKKREVPQNDPDVRRPWRMYAQASANAVAVDQRKSAEIPKCKANNFKMPEYQMTFRRADETDAAYNERLAVHKERQGILNEAFCAAFEMASDANLILNGISKAEQERGPDRYEAYFGDAGAEAVRTVFGRIFNYGFPPEQPSASAVRIYDGLPNECIEEIQCNDGVTTTMIFPAYVNAGEVLSFSKNIYVCPTFWELPASDATDSRAGVVLHEMAHLTKGAKAKSDERGQNAETIVFDFKYFEAGCMFLAQSEPAKSALNADSYHRFAMNRNDLGSGLARPYVRLGNAIGETMVIENGTLRMSRKPDPVRSQFALSNPKESKLIFPGDEYAHCKSEGAWTDECARCDDPDEKDGRCSEPICDCQVKIKDNWKPYFPVSGDPVVLVSTGGESVAIPQEATGRQPGSGEAGAHSQGISLIKLGTGDGLLKDGDEVALQAAPGVYLSVADDGTVVARRTDPSGTQDKFTLTFSNQDRFYAQFRSMGNRYVTIKRTLSGIGDEKFITADARELTLCSNCTFLVVNKNGRGLKHGDIIYLMASDGRGYVTVVNELTSGFVEIDSSNLGTSQAFIIEKENPTEDANIRTGDTVSLFTEKEKSPLWTGSQGIGQLYWSRVAFETMSQEEKNKRSKFLIELGR